MLGDFELGNTRLEFFYLRKRLLPLLIIVAITGVMASIATNEQLQIFNAIICLVAVLVVNYFFWIQWAVKVLSHYQSMLKHVIARVCHLDKLWRTNDKGVPVAIASFALIFFRCGISWRTVKSLAASVHWTHCVFCKTLRQTLATIDRALRIWTLGTVMPPAHPASIARAMSERSIATRNRTHGLLPVGQPFPAIFLSPLSIFSIVFTCAFFAPAIALVSAFRNSGKGFNRQFVVASNTRFCFHDLPLLDGNTYFTILSEAWQKTC